MQLRNSRGTADCVVLLFHLLLLKFGKIRSGICMNLNNLCPLLLYIVEVEAMDIAKIVIVTLVMIFYWLPIKKVNHAVVVSMHVAVYFTLKSCLLFNDFHLTNPFCVPQFPGWCPTGKSSPPTDCSLWWWFGKCTLPHVVKFGSNFFTNFEVKPR